MDIGQIGIIIEPLNDMFKCRDRILIDGDAEKSVGGRIKPDADPVEANRLTDFMQGFKKARLVS